jgi:hypothetical protein
MTATKLIGTNVTARDIRVCHIPLTGNLPAYNGYEAISGYGDVYYTNLYKEAS